MTRSYFATTARGLEEIAARELEFLGAKEVKPNCMMAFKPLIGAIISPVRKL